MLLKEKVSINQLSVRTALDIPYCNGSGSSFRVYDAELNKELFGTKRSMVVDGKGVPLGITVDAANRHMKMTKSTLKSVVVHRPEPTNNLLFSTKYSYYNFLY
jgi:hypothetical protein